MKNSIYIHQQDFVDGLVGPFPDLVSVQAHLDFQEARGDGARTLALYFEYPDRQNGDIVQLLSGGCLSVTPEQDRAFKFPE